ncbi:hypothetical protein cypCar_00042378 [Cyprinus carpio]|nr:hypothetical protein cypCar_00042378 [Cyprinus carpio]
MSETQKQSRKNSSDSNPWKSLGSPTLLWSPTSGLPLQDGLYTDARFPVQNMPIQTDVVWKRPKEICPFPQFIADGATRMDICQGELSDCWFLSAVASLSLNPSLLNLVVPSGQGFQQGYNGCFNFRGSFEKSNELGILFRHAYSVTGLETKCLNCENFVRLLRIEWNKVSAEEQRRVQRIQQEDGEFWMSLADFCQNFETMEVCHLSQDTLSESGIIKPWKCTSHHGQWIPQQGPPQYSLTLLEEDDDPSDPELTCSFLLALMQKCARQRGILFPVALHIYKARSERDASQLSLVLSTTKDLGYVQRRELVFRGRLAPGHYIIIPSTSEANQVGEFLLRVLTEKGNKTNRCKLLTIFEPMSPRLAGLPPVNEAKDLFVKHCVKGPYCSPLDLYNLLTEAIAKGVFAGCEKKLSLEHCKSFVVLMDVSCIAIVHF